METVLENLPPSRSRHSLTPCWLKSSLLCIPPPAAVCAWRSRCTALVTYLLSPCRQEFGPAMRAAASAAGRRATNGQQSLSVRATRRHTARTDNYSQTSEHRIRSDHFITRINTVLQSTKQSFHSSPQPYIKPYIKNIQSYIAETSIH